MKPITFSRKKQPREALHRAEVLEVRPHGVRETEIDEGAVRHGAHQIEHRARVRLEPVLQRLAHAAFARHAEETQLGIAQIAEVHGRFADADVLHEPHRVVDDRHEPERVQPDQELLGPGIGVREHRDEKREHDVLHADLATRDVDGEGGQERDHRQQCPARPERAHVSPEPRHFQDPSFFSSSKTSRRTPMPARAVARSIVSAG
jgi:hypothetical protein